MKRLFSNKRGEVRYGPKWQNTESSIDDDGGGGDLHTHKVATAQEDYGDLIPKGKTVEVTVKDGELMYLAALQGDWVAAEVLLGLDPNLAFDYVTEEGDRALHVAAAMKHEVFVQKLVGRMSNEELALIDGHGYTACCYAAMSGKVEIARAILDKNPGLVTVRDEEKAPLREAALLGDTGMLSFLLEYTKSEDLSSEEWFDLLLVAIRSNMYDVAVDIVKKDGSIAKMANKEGTALHLLARDQTTKFINSQSSSKMDYTFALDKGRINKQVKFSQLVEKVWGEMKEMEKASLLELMKTPVHILHDATKAGQVEMIMMLTCTYPHLIWETDSEGYTVFHIAVMYRQSDVFSLIHQVTAMMGFRKMWQDREGNNILHLAAEPAAIVEPKLAATIQIKKELKWFKVVKEIVPPSCVMMKNRKGLTPGELFSKKNKKLFEEGESGMRNAADSGMLIATILLTVIFTATFTVPGGYSSESGEPVLGKKKNCSVGSSSSTYSV